MTNSQCVICSLKGTMMPLLYTVLSILSQKLISFGNPQIRFLTHWGRVTHICVCKLTTIGSDNGLSPGRRQAIIWTNTAELLIRTLGTNFSEFLSEIHAFSFTKMHLKMSSAKWRPFCPGLNVLTAMLCGSKHGFHRISRCFGACSAPSRSLRQC